MSIENQASVYRWMSETFPGMDPDSPRKSIRLLEECIELCHASGASFAEINETVIRVGFKSLAKDQSLTWVGNYPRPEQIPAEAADVKIVLFGVSGMRGFDLDEAVDAKMAVNRGRRWKANGDGTGYHIKEAKGEATS